MALTDRRIRQIIREEITHHIVREGTDDRIEVPFQGGTAKFRLTTTRRDGTQVWTSIADVPNYSLSMEVAPSGKSAWQCHNTRTDKKEHGSSEDPRAAAAAAVECATRTVKTSGDLKITEIEMGGSADSGSRTVDLDVDVKFTWNGKPGEQTVNFTYFITEPGGIAERMAEWLSGAVVEMMGIEDDSDEYIISEEQVLDALGDDRMSEIVEFMRGEERSYNDSSSDDYYY
jgi:hypothetical protein